ncbi:hypothetical protein Tco_0610915 [Tanacetum coccineum]
MDTLKEFKIASGMTPSLPKSTAYFCNMINYVKLDILNILPFEKGKLPVKYLGVPLVPSCLLIRDCTELMEKASVFILPSHLMLDLEQLMRGFLWCQGEMRKGKAKVAWEAVCLPLLVLTSDSSSFHSILVAIKRQAQESRYTKLKTQDTLSQWDVSSNTDLNLLKCPLYDMQPDSHDHLFFECVFSLHVWEHVKRFMSIPNIPSDLSSILDFLIPLAKIRSARSVIAKLVFAASCYFIWQEHNYILFKKKKNADCPDVESSLEAAFDSYWAFPLMVYVRMGWLDCDCIVVHEFDGVWKVECLPIVVLFFPSLRFFPLGFSWEGFLRRHNWLAVYTSILLHQDDFEALCTLKWFFPIGDIVSVFDS